MAEARESRWRGRFRVRFWRALGVGPLVDRIARLEAELRASEERLHRHLQQVEGRLLESPQELATRAKARWAATGADPSLTWGRLLTGDAFVAAVMRHFTPGAQSRILEVGPGYGRILAAFLAQRPCFAHYQAIDLSPRVVGHVRTTFTDPRIAVDLQDVETLPPGEPFDLAWSALTFKHLFPDIACALAGIAARLRPGGTLAFDLVEGDSRYFEKEDGATFRRAYRRDEVQTLLAGAGLELVAFESVRHDPAEPESTRLLVVARRPGDGGAAP